MDPFSFAFGGGKGGFSFSDQLDNRNTNTIGEVDNRVSFGTSGGYSTLQLGMAAGAVVLVALLLGGKK